MVQPALDRRTSLLPARAREDGRSGHPRAREEGKNFPFVIQIKSLIMVIALPLPPDRYSFDGLCIRG
jgi:hypothetical protein